LYEFSLNLDKLIEILNLIEIVKEYFPRAFEYFNHDIVVNGRNKVQHLVMTEVELMKDVLHAFNLLELLYILLVDAPRLRQLVLDALQAPEEAEHLLVVLHNIVSKNCC